MCYPTTLVNIVVCGIVCINSYSEQYILSASHNLQNKHLPDLTPDENNISQILILFFCDYFLLIRFSSSCNVKCTGCKIDKKLTGFSLTHIFPYNIIKANILIIKEVTL